MPASAWTLVCVWRKPAVARRVGLAGEVRRRIARPADIFAGRTKLPHEWLCRVQRHGVGVHHDGLQVHLPSVVLAGGEVVLDHGHSIHHPHREVRHGNGRDGVLAVRKLASKVAPVFGLKRRVELALKVVALSLDLAHLCSKGADPFA